MSEPDIRPRSRREHSPTATRPTRTRPERRPEPRARAPSCARRRRALRRRDARRGRVLARPTRAARGPADVRRPRRRGPSGRGRHRRPACRPRREGGRPARVPSSARRRGQTATTRRRPRATGWRDQPSQRRLPRGGPAGLEGSRGRHARWPRPSSAWRSKPTPPASRPNRPRRRASQRATPSPTAEEAAEMAPARRPLAGCSGGPGRSRAATQHETPELWPMPQVDREARDHPPAARRPRRLRADRCRPVAATIRTSVGTGSSALTGLVDAISPGRSRHRRSTSRTTPVLGAVHPEPVPRHRRRAVPRSAIASTAWAGFADERVPSQRDLSLAVGYAGLDPMRIRRWPTEAECTTSSRTSPWRPTSGLPARPAG